MTIDLPAGIDIDLFTEMQTLMEEEFALLIAAYLEDTPKLLEQIRLAISAEDPALLASAAHQVKSTSASLGFVDLEGLAQTLENSDMGADSPTLYQRALQSFISLKPFLEKQIETE